MCAIINKITLFKSVFAFLFIIIQSFKTSNNTDIIEVKSILYSG